MFERDGTPGSQPPRPDDVVWWQGRCYDFGTLLDATPSDLSHLAAAGAHDAQSWWERVVELAPRTAMAIIASLGGR